MNGTEKEAKIKRSFSFESLVERIDHVNALEMFEQYQFVEVRKKCLEEMKRLPVNTCRAEWAETAITDLLQQHDNFFAEELLSWYLFSKKAAEAISHADVLEIRALEFAISISERSDDLLIEKVSKLVRGKLMYGGLSPWLVFINIRSLPGFLNKLFDELRVQSEIGYSKANWHCAERALEVIMKAKESRFLDKINEILLAYKKEEIKPNAFSFPNSWDFDQHIALFNSAKRILTKAKKENR